MNIKCKAYEFDTLKEYIFADIVAIHKGKWILCKHKQRTTWENPGGHIEKGETPLDAAKRELFEETGAIDFIIEPLCDYWVHASMDGKELIGNGQIFLANVYTLNGIPSYSEMEKICLFEVPPDNLTYPGYSNVIFPIAIKIIKEKMW